MDWLADIKEKLRRFLVYVSNKSRSRVSCSRTFSWHYLPRFSDWAFTPFYPFSPAWPQFISEAQRSCVISASHSHLQRSLSMLWIKKTKESCCDPFKWLYEWERVGMQPCYSLHIPAIQTNTTLVTSQPMAGITVRGCMLLRQRAHIHFQTWNHLGGLLYTVNQNSPWSLTNL